MTQKQYKNWLGNYHPRMQNQWNIQDQFAKQMNGQNQNNHHQEWQQNQNQQCNQFHRNQFSFDGLQDEGKSQKMFAKLFGDPDLERQNEFDNNDNGYRYHQNNVQECYNNNNQFNQQKFIPRANMFNPLNMTQQNGHNFHPMQMHTTHHNQNNMHPNMQINNLHPDGQINNLHPNMNMNGNFPQFPTNPQQFPPHMGGQDQMFDPRYGGHQMQQQHHQQRWPMHNHNFNHGGMARGGPFQNQPFQGSRFPNSQNFQGQNQNLGVPNPLQQHFGNMNGNNNYQFMQNPMNQQNFHPQVNQVCESPEPLSQQNKPSKCFKVKKKQISDVQCFEQQLSDNENSATKMKGNAKFKFSRTEDELGMPKVICQHQNRQQWKIELDCPGWQNAFLQVELQKDDRNNRLCRNYVFVRGKKEEETSAGSVVVKFEKKIPVPHEVDIKYVRAHMNKSGILTINADKQ